MIEATRAEPDPSDSILMSLARAAMATRTEGDRPSWPELDLDDPEQRKFGDYELLEEIGRGGMGVVYRARQRSLDRDVAIKFIAAGIADSVNVARFLGEARAAARLMHPNIVPVHEVGSIDGLHYFSMPLIRGRSLAQQLDERLPGEDEAIALLLKLCDSIDYAHRLGLLHLDLKPANVLIGEHGEPLVADFGLARHMDERQGIDAQEVSGTPSFMAPEQVLIKQYRLTPATDLYALGAMLYLMLTGASPHGTGGPDELTQRAIAGRVRPVRELNPAVSADLAAVCMKCLELMPRDRYARVADLADDLRRIRDGHPVSVRTPGRWERLRRWYQRDRRYANTVFAMVLTAFVGTVLSTSGWLVAEHQRSLADAHRQLAEQERRVALTERDRALDASQLGAWLFARSRLPANGEADQAQALIRWLSDRLPGSDRQAAVLDTFARALATEDLGALDSLVQPLVQVLGRDYRRQVIAALERGTRPDRYAMAARLAWFDERDSEDPLEFRRLLDLAIAAQPEDPVGWQIATLFCFGPDGQRCLRPEASARLQALDPDNAFHWLLSADTDNDAEAAQALAEATRRSRFDDYYTTTFVAYIKAFDLAGVPAPQLLSGPIRTLLPKERPEQLIALWESASFPVPHYVTRLLRPCDPLRSGQIPADRHEQCLRLGQLMAHSKSSLLARQLGGVLIRRFAPDTPEAADAYDFRRRYLYTVERTEQINLARHYSYPLSEFLRVIEQSGEYEAWMERLKFLGEPTEPPPDWTPANPDALLLPEQRRSRP